MNETSIRWTGKTWGFASGCYDAGPECRFCYARDIAENERFSGGFPNGFNLTLREHKLNEPLSQREPELIFPGSMTDIGLEELPLDYFGKVIDVMRRAKHHRFQPVTKRPGIVARKLRELGVSMPDNVWMGATIGAVEGLSRLDELFTIPGPRLYWLSVEPLLGDLAAAPAFQRAVSRLGWMVVGGESGGHATWPEKIRRALRRKHPTTRAPMTAAELFEHDLARAEGWARSWAESHGADARPATRSVLERMAADIAGRFLVERGASGAWLPTREGMARVASIVALADAAKLPVFFKQWGGPRPDSAGHALGDRETDVWPTAALPEGWLARRQAKTRRTLPVISAAS